jgi:hypothetical protein
VTNGLFQAMLDFGAGAFNGANRWLEIAVRSNGVGNFVVLSPRQEVTPTPYASVANGLNTNAIIQAQSLNVGVNNQRNGTLVTIAGGSGNVMNSDYGVIAGGTGNQAGSGGSPSANTYATVGGGELNQSLNNFSVVGGGLQNTANGDYATISGGGRNIAYYYSTVAGGFGNNAFSSGSVIGGGINNTNLASSATISGGQNNLTQPGATYSVIVGGNRNLAKGSGGFIGGGAFNTVSNYDVVVGGVSNHIGADFSIIVSGTGDQIAGTTSWIATGDHDSVFANFAGIGGGQGSMIQSGADYSFIGGGGQNDIATNAPYSAIGGGASNVIGGNFFGAGVVCSTIPGGLSNTAAGSYTFAAGRQAKANYDGDFVWADSQGLDFASTATNQFLLRAGGGVGVGTANPGAGLEVQSPVKFATAIKGTATGTGVYGYSTGAASSDYGVYGLGPNGVYGYDSLGNGIGVFGTSSTGDGLRGVSTSGNGVNGSSGSRYGVVGTSPAGTGGYFSGGTAAIFANGNVGIGTASPASALEISRDIGAGLGPVLRLNRSSATGNQLFLSFADGDSDIAGLYVPAGTDDLRFNNGHADLVTITSGGNVGIGTVSPGYVLDVNGPIHASGNVCAANVSCSSDRNAKENFEQTDPAEVLQKVVSLPITKWNFKQDATRHLGPMAQDFYEAFQIGTDDKHIGMLDESGVALAAIQGLNQKVEGDNAALQAENAELKARLAKLEQLLNVKNGGAK